MRYVIVGLFMAGWCIFQIGCEKSESETSRPPEVVVPMVASKVVETQLAEAGCAMCSYGIEGVQSCQLAVKIGDKAYLATGVEIDAHAAGLCAGVKPAEMAGKIEGDKFIASRLELKP